MKGHMFSDDMSCGGIKFLSIGRLLKSQLSQIILDREDWQVMLHKVAERHD